MREGNEISVHHVHDIPMCIREVELEWGVPVLSDKQIDQERRPEMYHLYETYNEALSFIRILQGLNGARG